MMSPFGTSLTKAEQGLLEQDKVFGVYAYWSDCADGTVWNRPEAWAASSLYLDNVAFSYSDGNWGGRDQAYYWPFEGSLMFAGYSPHQSVSDGTITGVSLTPNVSDTNPYLAVTFSHVTEDVTEGNVTYKKADVSKMPDLMWFDVKDANTGQTADKTSNPINLTFRHALSKISLAFTDSGNWYRLKDVRLTGCIYSGTFYSGMTAGWLPDIDNVAHYILPINTQIQDAKTVYPKLQGQVFDDLFIIPQYLNGIFPTMGGTVESEVDVKLEFTVTDNDYFGEQTVEIILKDYTQRWEIGKSYQYNIAVNADSIEFGTPTFTITTQTVSM